MRECVLSDGDSDCGRDGERHGSAGGDASELPRGVSQRAAPEVPVRVRGSLPHAGLLLQPSPPTGTATSNLSHNDTVHRTAKVTT